MKEEKDIQPIDKLFRQSLEGYTPAPPASVWKHIRLRLGGGGSSFIRFFTDNMGLFVGSTLLIGLAGIFVYVLFFSKSTDTTGNAQLKTGTQNTSAENKSVSVTRSDSLNYQTTTDSVGLTDQVFNAEMKVSVSEKAKGKNSDRSKGLIAGLASKSGNQDAGNQRNSSNSDKISPGTQISEANKQEITIAGNTPSGINPFPPNSKVQSLNQETVKQNDTLLITAETRNQGAENLIESESVSANPLITVNDLDEKSIEKTDILPVGSTNEPGSSSLPAAAPATNNPSPVDNVKTPSEKVFSYYFGLSGSFGQEILKGFNSSAFYSGTALAGLTHKKTNFSFETGIGYNYYEDQGNYQFDFKQSDTLGYTGYTLFNTSDSSYLFIYKPTISDTLFSLDTVTKTSYSYLNIPFYFSKQILRRGKFSAGIKTGPSVEFLLSRKETQPVYQLTGSDLLQTENKSYSRMSTNWQWLIAPQFSWDITDKIRFRLEPAAMFYLNTPYETENRPPVKPYILSITGGLLFKIE